MKPPRSTAPTRFSDFARSTFPHLRHVILVVVLLSSIWTANSFENIWLMTQGGPSDATMVFPVLAYFGMQTQRLGEAAAVSVAMVPALADSGVFRHNPHRTGGRIDVCPPTNTSPQDSIGGISVST